MWAASVAVIIALPMGVFSSPLQARGAQTNATCQSSFSWMDNEKGMSPCYVVAQLLGACHSDVWTIGALTQGHHYDAPTDTTADLCSCSWGTYNLLQGCTACQGFDNSILTWAGYSSGSCSGKTVDNYFPTNITLPNDAAVPYWAAVDPSQWTNARFDASQAKSLDDQGHADLIQGQSTTTSTHKSNAGPIAGGVVGGVLGLAAIIGIIWLLRRRRAAQTARGEKAQWDSTQAIPFNGRPSHERNISAPSTKTSFFGRPVLGLRNLMGSPTSATETLSEGTPEQPHPHLPNLPLRSLERTEDVITPFSLTTRTPPGLITPGSSKESHDRSYFDEHGVRMAPTAHLHEDPSFSGVAVPRSTVSSAAMSDRVVSTGDISISSIANHTFENAFPAPNPPAYSPSPPPAGAGHALNASISSVNSAASGAGHRKGQGSGDSLESLGSGLAHVATVDRMSTVPETSERTSTAIGTGTGTGTGTGLTTAMLQVIREHDRPTEHRDGEADMPDIA